MTSPSVMAPGLLDARASGLSVGLVTGDFDSGAFSVYFMGVGGFQAVLTGLYLAFHRKDHGDW